MNKLYQFLIKMNLKYLMANNVKIKKQGGI